MIGLHVLIGVTGKKYPYLVCPCDTPFPNRPANYALAGFGDGRLEILYLGQDAKLATRLSRHFQFEYPPNEAVHLVLVRYNSALEDRVAELLDLVCAYSPSWNVEAA